MIIRHTPIGIAALLATLVVPWIASAQAESKPNILWIITDDQRPDSVSAYNRLVYGKDESPLGYVESPNIDKLAAEGIMFTRAMCNSPACGPSRGSMHSGRYPFRNGHYAFELTHQNPDFIRPVVPQILREQGYATATFGKDGPYIYRWGPGQGFHDPGFYDVRVHNKHTLQRNAVGDFATLESFGKGGYLGKTEIVYYPDGSQRTYFLKRVDGKSTEDDLAAVAQTDKELEILRSYTCGGLKSLVFGGVNPKPAADTADAHIATAMKNYLANAGRTYKTLWGEEAQGADTTKPQFIHLGFHFPHTPVLPPKSFRDRFKTKNYRVPEFDRQELAKLPPQLVRLYESCKVDGMTEAEKQQAIQDYYAFCAHGDAQIGVAVEAFKAYCKTANQEYLIVFTVGDHSWHLGEQGIEAKFGPWGQSVANAAILVSSDESLIPAGGHDDKMIEFVDFAPTMLQAGGVDLQDPKYDFLDGVSLFDVLGGTAPKREYILGEIHLVAGPRAYMYTDRFRFSMRSRPFPGQVNEQNFGKNIKWALEAPLEKVDLALYDLKHDPLERNNVANDPDYRELAAWFRSKLGNIILGDGRVECDWSKANSYVISDFAKGADDKQADIPEHLIP
ncbi:sulfatase-like hydrolase/transferase [Stieleria sp. ICT_E10.1]|uniref:sulfatase-like hydrolase/transferase n=1 Tax=Stieleria sedimenti TaxID=2976331 RepID=UPI00217F4DAA|nr:sulfatase-like hydrolase/transferase [Stieleria sedimenti]MCS7466046.1 sulfatase-like hydrolase/transferase [Stieleria sedimenti]